MRAGLSLYCCANGPMKVTKRRMKMKTVTEDRQHSKKPQECAPFLPAMPSQRTLASSRGYERKHFSLRRLS